ncbi:MAG: hypothetical protein ACRYFS_25570 [Janthinobacterium lividum]
MSKFQSALPVVCLLLSCLHLMPVFGNADFEANRLKAAAANPPGVSLTLSLPTGKSQFHPGEMIPLSAAFTSSTPGTYQLNSDPGSRDLQWGGDAFQCDPQKGSTDSLRVFYDHSFGIAYSGPGPRFQALTGQPVSIPYTLNEWMRFDTPGRYHVFLTSHRIVDGAEKHNSLFFLGRAVTSNTVEFEILPDDPVSDAKTLQDVLPLFNTESNVYHARIGQTAAARTVRFLGTPDAGRTMIARYGTYTEYESLNSFAFYQTRLGLYGFPDRPFIIHEMQRRIADPAFPIYSFFLDDLAETQFLDVYPQFVPPYAAGDPARDKERQDLIAQRRKTLADFREQDRQALAAAPKSGPAQAIKLYALLTADYQHLNTPEHQKFAQALIPIFDDLTPEEQNNLLDENGYWREVSGPDMLPILRRVYAEPMPNTNWGSFQDDDKVQRRSLALHHLVELSPAEGRPLLLAEIKSPSPWVDLPTLCSLPDQTLPMLDMALAANLENSLLHGQGDSTFTSRLVERYATAAILPRVKAVYPHAGCGDQSDLLAYFLRTDRAYGAAHLEPALAQRKGVYCYRYELGEVAALRFGPDVERLAVIHLHDPDEQVAVDAAKVLGTYGSAAAESPLWARMREWHRQWAGKANQIDLANHPVSETGALEYALTQALSTAPGWLLDLGQLKVLKSLCVTPGGRQNMEALVQDWTVPVSIAYQEGDGWRAAQYGPMSSVPALENKLAQFPSGTRFRIFYEGALADTQQAQAYHRLGTFLKKRGMRLEMQSFPPH